MPIIYDTHRTYIQTKKSFVWVYVLYVVHVHVCTYIDTHMHINGKHTYYFVDAAVLGCSHVCIDMCTNMYIYRIQDLYTCKDMTLYVYCAVCVVYDMYICPVCVVYTYVPLLMPHCLTLLRCACVCECVYVWVFWYGCGHSCGCG